ncbi:TetR family transcriptional regulator C-terminal domain-containing protein [Asaia sp. HN128]|uniref:TetR family transcriptional regulator C-terminal domain-containing protein n=1 Tax=Asaia sp. HN128 TaxID=3081234 RepID=UPI003018F4B4
MTESLATPIDSPPDDASSAKTHGGSSRQVSDRKAVIAPRHKSGRPRKQSAPRQAMVPQILNAAEWTFGTRGLKGTRLEEIAALCAIPKANILYYYGSKEELYNATLARLLDIWLKDADHWLSPQRDPLEGVEGYLRAKIAFSRTRPEGSRLFAQELLSGGQMVRDFLRHTLRAHVARHDLVFRDWQARGLMTPIDTTHFLSLLWSGTQAYADMQVQFEALLGHAPLRDSDFEAAVETFMTLLRPLFPRQA